MSTVTIEQIQSKIKNRDFIVLADKRTTICNLYLENGYTVRGESSCVDEANFDKALGEQYAAESAVSKVWPLEGYLLAQSLYEKKCCDGKALNFGQALEVLKRGGTVAREGWNGKGMWLAYSPGYVGLKADQFWAGPNRDFAKKSGGAVNVLPCITMKTASDDVLIGWLASQSDMLAEDWVVVTDGENHGE